MKKNASTSGWRSGTGVTGIRCLIWCVPSVLLTEYPAPEALSSAKNPPAAGVLPAGVYRSFAPAAFLCYHGTESAKKEETRDMKNMAYRISDPADLSGRGAAASAAAARLSRAVRYRPVSRPAVRVPLPEAGRLCPVFLSDGIRLRQAAGAHPQAPAPLAAGGGLCADRHGAGLPAQQRAAHALPAGQRLGTRAAYV